MATIQPSNFSLFVTEMRLCLNDKCNILSKWAYSERYYDMHGRIQILWRRRQTSHQMLPRAFSAPVPILLEFFNLDF